MAERTQRKGRARTIRLVLATFAACLVLILLAAASMAYSYYRDLREVAQHDLGSVLDEDERPEKLNEAITILLIGSDDRAENEEYGGHYMEGGRSDSLMLVHISPDRDEVTAINFPRDSLVQLPECGPYAGHDGTDGYYGMINAALFHGGPPCVVRTIESLTDIHIDHFAHMDFSGFRDMVDAVGGVDMCVPEPLQDERAHLDLEAGEQRLDGEEALAFVRARYEIGDGGDIGRIDRQQMFLAAFASEVLDDDLLVQPSQLRTLLDSVMEHVTTDTELTLSTMLSLGSTLSDVELDDISFYTVPWWQAPSDPNRVIWNEELASALFESVAQDDPIDPELFIESGEEPEESTDSPTAEYHAEEEEPSQAATAPGDLDRRDATANPCEEGLGSGTENEW